MMPLIAYQGAYYHMIYGLCAPSGLQGHCTPLTSQFLWTLFLPASKREQPHIISKSARPINVIIRELPLLLQESDTEALTVACR